MLTMQDALARLIAYWTAQGCLTVQPMNTEVGAGTLNPATFLRVLGPEPWRVVYVEPSVRPDDSRYGENPNRIQTHTQVQVVLKPEPGDAQALYLGSLAALGVDVAAHDVRFVEDNWASPAVGAWGLGWEVWLDGLEITQFTYFQQAGGRTLDPPSVEITYGIERIMMALQEVRDFKQIIYAPGIAAPSDGPGVGGVTSPGVSYGEVFGQGEYEMSRYYLDDADVATNRQLLELYAAEAQRLIDDGLPVPAHTYVLKCSHAFNVLDARGAVSTADRAAEFTRMRRLAGDVARLWVLRRDELGHPLGVAAPPPRAVPAPVASSATTPQPLVFEIGVEEMPPAAARAARDQVERLLTTELAATRLEHGDVRVFATPRRLIAAVGAVAAREPDRVRTVQGPRVGAPDRAVQGFARAHGVAVADLRDAGSHWAADVFEAGADAPAVLATVLAKVVSGLRAAKNMRWNDPQLAFSRPIRWLLALWGADIVPVAVSTLLAGRQTRLLRTAPLPVASIASADTFMETIAVNGIVADAEDRRDLIVAGAQDLVFGTGRIDVTAENALIDEIAYLVEQPTPLLGTFDEAYLALPDVVLTTTMRKHQRYLPVRDETGALLPMFVTVANGPVDVEVVRAGNEAVLRARFEDAAFFYRADRATPLAAMRDRLAGLTFTDKLGSMADRAARIAALAPAIAPPGVDAAVLARAAQLVKVDLGAQLVTEMTSLAGVLARDYALAAGEPPAVAEAVFEAELPRHAGDRLPATLPGAVLSVADRLDLVTGLAATVGLPTGSSDPFALRRAVLGLIAVHREQPALAAVSLTAGLAAAAAGQPVPVSAGVLADVSAFLAARLEQVLVEEGQPVDWVRAALVHADRPAVVDRTLYELSTLVGDETFEAVAETLGRARRIVPPGGHARYDSALLTEPAESALAAAVTRVAAEPATDLTRFTRAAAALVEPVARFFDEVYVMADDPAVRAARLGLLAAVRDLGAGLLDWSQLRLATR